MCPVFQLVYISRAAIDLTYSDLQTILDSSRKNNENLDLTGVLIYRDGFFMQLLEGSEENVLKILSRIVADRRNNHLQVIVESKSNMRIFDSWRMAYLDGDIELLECREPLEKLMKAAIENSSIENCRILPLLRAVRTQFAQMHT